MMRSLLARAVNPVISIIDALMSWGVIAAALRERPRQRSYQRDRSFVF